jgi:hypothetical protein
MSACRGQQLEKLIIKLKSGMGLAHSTFFHGVLVALRLGVKRFSYL